MLNLLFIIYNLQSYYLINIFFGDENVRYENMNIFIVNGEYDILLWILCQLVVQGQGIISSIINNDMAQQYKRLKRPKFSPPAFIFAIIWSILFFLMGTSFYRILMVGSQGYDIKKPVIIFVIQLILNFAWTFIYFRLKNRKVAALELLFLVISIVFTILSFYPLDKMAFGLLLPYLIWCLYALYLNIEGWRLNK